MKLLIFQLFGGILQATVSINTMIEQKSAIESVAPEPLATHTAADFTHSQPVPFVVEHIPEVKLDAENPVEASLAKAYQTGAIYELEGIPVEHGFTALRAVSDQLNRSETEGSDTERTQLAHDQLKIVFGNALGETRTDFIPIDAYTVTIQALIATVGRRGSTPEGRAALRALTAFGLPPSRSRQE